MPNLIFIISLLIPTVLFAGGHGGGVLSVGQDQALKSPVEMIYSVGNDGEYMNFIRATWENGKWNMKEESLVLRDFDSPVHNAIRESDAIRNWAPIEVRN